MKTVLHIGPPKTASTSLQNSIIPKLGRPFQIKPAWLRALAVEPEFHTDEEFPAGAIFSDEIAGWFIFQPPETVAARLAKLFTDATIVYVKRKPLEWFYSLYRWRLWNWVRNQKTAIEMFKTVMTPPTADELFDSEREAHRTTGRGFFAMADLTNVREIFSSSFRFEVVDYELLKTDPGAFVRDFTRACGTEMSLSLTHENKAEYANMEAALRSVAHKVPEHVREKFREYYLHSRLSGTREANLIAMQ